MAPEPSNLNAFGLTASLVGSYLSFASAIIVAAIWPIFGLLVIWMFRPHVIGLLPFVARFDLWGAKVDMHRRVAQAERAADADAILGATREAVDATTQSSNEPQPEPSVEKEAEAKLSVEHAAHLLRNNPEKVPSAVLRFISKHGLLANDPAATIASTWGEVQRAVIEAAVVLGLPPDAPTSQVVWMLPRGTLGSTGLIRLLDELEGIYLSAAKAPSSADLSIAARFSLLAERAISQLRTSTDRARNLKG